MAQTSRLVLEIDSRDAEQKAIDVRKALDALEDAGIRVKPALDKAGAGMEKMGKDAEKATKSIEDEADELERLLGQIDPVVRRLGELDKQEQDLARHRKAGKLDSATYDEYQAKINQTRAGLTRFDDSLTRTGNTAKQTAAALRGVPAQFTDIAVSLQGGQNPLTVFLQQGGQLKDMFGGAGPAAKALGGYVLGLVNPFTVAAAAVGTLGLAYYQGSQEADSFRQAIITTGNASGTSSLALAGMATIISATVGTTGKAAETLALMAANGKIASSSFGQIATAAIGFEQVTGKAVSATVAEFDALADNPVKTLATLNDKYNFLTASVYEQVRAAQKMGEKEQAAAIAQDAYAKALADRTKMIKESLGTIEIAWNAITGAAKRGWDAMLGVGRQQSLDEQIANTKQLLEDRKTSFAARMFSDTLGEGSDSTRFLQTRLNLLEKQKFLLTEQDKAEGEKARIQREGQQAFEEFSNGVEAAGSRDQKLNKALLEDQKRINAARAAGYTITQADVDASEKAIRDKFKEPKTAMPKAYTEDSGQKMLDEARQRFAVLQQQNKAITDQTTGSATLGAEAKKLIELETVLADLKSKSTLTAAQKQILAMGELNLAQQKQNAALEKANELTKERFENEAKLKAFRENLGSQLELSREGQANELSGAGQSDRLRARLQEDLKIRQDYQKQLDKLTRDYNKIDNPTANDTDLYKGETDALRSALATRMADQQNYYAAQDAMRGEWLVGVSESWQNYVDIATNYNEQAREATESILGDTTSSISEGIQDVVKGTESLGDAFGNLAGTMANSVLGALSDIAAKWVVVQALKMAGITAETGAVVAAEGTKAAAKVAADGVAEASSLSTIATTLAANVAAAIETLASWAPAALVASIGSFGAAAVVGGTALIAAYALIKGISGGFAEGGYTGAGGKYEPAGVVHKGEVVWSQADIRRFGGVSAVEGLRTGNVTPIGMAKASRSASTGSQGGSVSPIQQNINVHNYTSSQVETRQRSNGDIDVIVKAAVEEVAGQFSSGYGEVVDAYEGAYGARRQGG